MDHGRVSTILITLLTPILGYIAANPEPLQQAIQSLGYTEYAPLIIAIIITLYNLLYPQPNNNNDDDETQN